MLYKQAELLWWKFESHTKVYYQIYRNDNCKTIHPSILYIYTMIITNSTNMPLNNSATVQRNITVLS